MGTGIAQVALLASHPVRLVDTDGRRRTSSGPDRPRHRASFAGKRGLAGDQLNAAVDNVLSALPSPPDPAAAVDGAALAIEAVAETPRPPTGGLPGARWRGSERDPRDNTSALSVAAGSRRDRYQSPGSHTSVCDSSSTQVPARWLSRRSRVAPNTDPSAVAAVAKVVTGWGKTPVRSADTPASPSSIRSTGPSPSKRCG
jgi:3-hydroxybutyryl-CoA dehydrogenase